MRDFIGTIFLLFLMFFAQSANAQTADELKRKYTLLEEDSYLVRPDIILEVLFDQNREAYELEIHPNRLKKDDYLSSPISFDIARELITELAPRSKLGKYVSSMSFNGGCSGAGLTYYENGQVWVASENCGGSHVGVTEIRITWKKTTWKPAKLEFMDEP